MKNNTKKVIKYNETGRKNVCRFIGVTLFIGLLVCLLKPIPEVIIITVVLIICSVPLILYAILWGARPEQINFYKDKFTTTESSDEYRYTEFQRVYFTKYKQIVLKTESERVVCELLGKSNTQSFKTYFNILTEFSNHGKEIIIDDIWYNIMPPSDDCDDILTWKRIGIEYAVLIGALIIFLICAKSKGLN